MPRRTDIPTRRDVTEKVDRSDREMREKVEVLDSRAEDFETIRRTLEELEQLGTAEGTDAVAGKIEQAENVTVEMFDREDERLDRLQEDNVEHQTDLRERSDSVESDAEKITEAERKVGAKEISSEVAEAREAALRDLEFLTDQERRAKEAREESERLQKEHQARIRKHKE